MNRNIDPQSDTNDTQGHMPRIRPQAGDPAGVADTQGHMPAIRNSVDQADTDGHGRIHGAVEEADTEGHVAKGHSKGDELGIQIDP